MAAIDVKIKTTVDTNDSVEGLLDLEKGVKKASVTITGLQDKLDGLKKKAEGLDITSKEFKKLQKEIVKTDASLKNASKSLEGLDTEGKAGELGKLAGGLGAVGTAAALAFGDNKDAEKFFKTFATGLAITNAAKGGVEAFTAAQKLLRAGIIADTVAQVKNTAVRVGSAVATAAVTAATTIATAAQWLWNAAITANPIGLIVVAIAAAVAGIIALGVWIYKNIETVKEWSKYLLLLLGPLGYIALAYIEMQEAEQKQADQLKKNAKKERDIAKKKIKDIKKVREEENKAHKLRQTAFDLEIETLEAAGKSSYTVRLGKLKDILAEEKARLEANRRIVQAEFTKYENIAALQGKSLKELAAANGVNLEEVQKQIDASYLTQEKAIQSAENSITRLKREENEKRTSNAEDTSDDVVETVEDEVEEIKKIRQKQADDLVLINQSMNNQLATDNNQTYEEWLAEEEALADAREVIRSQSISNIEAGFKLLGEVGEKNKVLQATAIIGENAVGIAKQVIATQSAIALFTAKTAALPGGVALAAGYAAKAKVGLGIGIAASAVATGKALASLGKGGGSGSSAGGGVSVPAASSSSTSSADTSAPTVNFTGTAGDTGGANSNTAGSNQVPVIVRAIVTETDITNAQGNVSNIEDFAGFGPG